MIENWREQQRIVMRDYYKWKRGRKYGKADDVGLVEELIEGGTEDSAESGIETAPNEKDPIGRLTNQIL